MVVVRMGMTMMVFILVDMERKSSITVVSAGQTPLIINVMIQRSNAQVLTTTAKDKFLEESYDIMVIW
jgi:hypothetical protein